MAQSIHELAGRTKESHDNDPAEIRTEHFSNETLKHADLVTYLWLVTKQTELLKGLCIMRGFTNLTLEQASWI
jgi:hypothetical protein